MYVPVLPCEEHEEKLEEEQEKRQVFAETLRYLTVATYEGAALSYIEEGLRLLRKGCHDAHTWVCVHKSKHCVSVESDGDTVYAFQYPGVCARVIIPCGAEV